jgi:TPR repeat protein
LASADSEAVFGGKAISYSEFMIISENLDRVFDLSLNDSNRANAAYAVGMAFCNGKGVKQSDTLATIFLSGAHELEHRYAAFELGQLYSKKRIWFRRDQPLADHWYSKETSDAKRVRELAPKYALLFESLRENKSALQGVPEDVIKTIGNFLSRL